MDADQAGVYQLRSPVVALLILPADVHILNIVLSHRETYTIYVAFELLDPTTSS